MFHVYVCIRFTRNTGVCRYRENFHCLLYHVRHSFLCIFVDVVVALVSSFIFRSGSSVSLFVFVLNICFFFFRFAAWCHFANQSTPSAKERKRERKGAESHLDQKIQLEGLLCVIISCIFLFCATVVDVMPIQIVPLQALFLLSFFFTSFLVRISCVLFSIRSFLLWVCFIPFCFDCFQFIYFLFFFFRKIYFIYCLQHPRSYLQYTHFYIEFYLHASLSIFTS